MLRRSLAGLDRRRLRLVLGVFFLALAVPSTILIWHARGQLKWAAFHQQQQLAEEVAARIDARFTDLVASEEARSFADYAFLVVEGDPAQSFVQRSPLSTFPVETSIPGVIGYFQVGADGAFSTPLLPIGADATSYGVPSEEVNARVALQNRIWQILSENELVQRNEPRAAGNEPVERDEAARKDAALGEAHGASASAAMETGIGDAPAILAPERSGSFAQAPFDELTGKGNQAKREQKSANVLGRVEDLKLDDSRYAAAPEQARRQALESHSLVESRAPRKEKAALPETTMAAAPAAAPESPSADAPTMTDSAAGGRAARAIAGALTKSAADARANLRVHTFESEVDPFKLSLLGSGEFVLFRNVWREGGRYIQGVLIEQRPFLEGVAAAAFRASTLAATTDLVVADRNDVLALYAGGEGGGYLSEPAELNGALLHRTHLTAPLNDLELIFSVHRLPPAPGASLLNGLAAILAIVLCGGFWLMYRLGTGQIALARQQQDFVSAVSHELKTPLTSIRMYGEMLRAGWGSDAQKQGWYEYIYGESERLSRLINNVLQLARMNRNELPLTLKPVSCAEVTDAIRSKIATQVERAGFALDLRCEPDAANTTLRVDPDALLQIVINLVDNAIKFSAKAEEKRIEVVLRRLHDARLLLSVRDYGPGVPKDQTRRIFELFYRSESELTRETVGTGIGLALVDQLARAMHARVDVLNREPGAEFRVLFPV